MKDMKHVNLIIGSCLKSMLI